MEYFLETSDTIPEGVGFSHFGPIHLTWLIIAAVMIVANCLLYAAHHSGCLPCPLE